MGRKKIVYIKSYFIITERLVTIILFPFLAALVKNPTFRCKRNFVHYEGCLYERASSQCGMSHVLDIMGMQSVVF